MWSDLLPFDPAGILFPAAPLLLALAALLTFRHPEWARRLAGALCLPVALLAAAAVPADALGGLMLALTAFIGWVILRYSDRYLANHPRQPAYLRGLLLTLAAVWALVGANHLLLLVLAWAATDVFLHGLLTFFRERPAALLAARKRLLAVGAANGLLLAGSIWLYARFGTFALDGLAQAIAAPGGQDGLTGPALLITLGVILKSAQLPVHGWILQVMEAPTPVSALLHAGIVNIGGFVLLRLAGLLEAAPVAQALLVTVGGLTAGLAALVMMTRVSVKVMLAWSTCAQMGFMLLEIGLGAYPLALLHLLAHSLYKAHAFLAAGGTARRLTRLPAPRAAQTVPFAGLALGLAGLATVAWLAGLDPRQEPALLILGLALLTGLVPLLRDAAVANRTVRLRLAGAALGLVLAYALWHHLFAAVLPLATAAPSVVWLALPALGLVLLQVVQETVIARPDGALARRLHPLAFAGFHLDEGMTRLTLRLWPGAVTPVAPSTPVFQPANREHA
ncbi:NAD(P)H-quinone oxidoreductase subunit 5 [Fluviicoccus keumensis]|uniref:Probable inorganic carbon transporter subunit DabB n=1 Tax=Fluviicoccus keumensis TaxID=1435465 RepID=A0A4V2G6A6_9GAMM|nr:NADH-quinone oxidoreductase subunit L [Fluviicoccus keumensis]RZU47996.1 NAD(P)H-quinone oxidoreductase subunit 5 [Fluviicoccus keumensis]